MASISEEEENYIRITLLLKGVSPRAVRTYFDREFPPTSLPSTLKTNYNTLHDLRKKRVLNQAQWNLLFPRNGVTDSQNFDISLMICLIRNLASVIPPINGFDQLPLPSETTAGADLARIKWYRNKLARHDSNTMGNVHFNTAWRDISGALSRLGGPAIHQECQELKVKVLDQSNQGVMLEIQQSMKDNKELGQKIHSSQTDNSKKLKKSMKKILRHLQTLRSQVEIQPNVRGTASSSSSSVSMSLRTNYARIGNALQQLFPNILQELLTLKEPPQKLSHDVNTNRYLLKNLRADEWSLINNVMTKGYANFDIPFINKLIKHLNIVPPPTQGWDHSTSPCTTEVTTGDDLERIQRMRKQILHRGNAQVTDTELSQYFTQLKNIAGRLETYLGKQAGEFVNKLINLETCCMDDERPTELKKRALDCSKELHDVGNDADNLKEGSIKRLKLSGDASTFSLLDNIKRSQFKAKPTHVKDDVEINGYKRVTNKDQFYQLHIVCDNFVVDCIIDGRLKRKCRKSVAEFQECTEKMAQWRQAQSAVHEKFNKKFLHFVKWRKSFLCQYFLNHTLFNEIENRILVNALYSTIANDDAETAKFIGWQIARNFLKYINSPLYDIWLASLCTCKGRKATKLYSFFCSAKVTIIIMVPQLIKDIVKDFEGIPIKQVAYHCEIFKEAKAISDQKAKLLKRDQKIQCHIPGPLAETLFNNHRRLSLVCPSEIKSMYFRFFNKPTFRTCSCIQLYCHVKGAIPIGEKHFPSKLNGIPTDVIEGFPRFSSKHIRIGDSVTNTRVKGTVGGFCLFYGREAFLTCAHTMMDWDTLLSIELKHHVQQESVHVYTGGNILDETLLCGKVVNHSYTHGSPTEISTDVALVEIDNGISVSADDFVNTRGNRLFHFAELGLKSGYLQDGYIRSIHELPGQNVEVVCAGAVSGLNNSFTLISKVPRRILAREDLQSASANLETRSMEFLQAQVSMPVHMKVRAIVHESRNEEAESDRTVRFYNQLAVHNIPFEQGDSGACVYITNGYTETGCLGMAIADLPGGGCIVTPMAKLLENLGLIKK